jgi:hypothetical protein
MLSNVNDYMLSNSVGVSGGYSGSCTPCFANNISVNCFTGKQNNVTLYEVQISNYL